MAQVPLYLDWSFWQGVAAFAALFISLAPSVQKLFKGNRLDIEVHNTIHLAHTVGNPNVNLFIMLRNTGGAPIRVTSLYLRFKPLNSQAFDVVGQAYYPQLSDARNVLLTPFKIAPNEDWEHLVYFYNNFGRQEKQKYSEVTTNLRNNLAHKAANEPTPQHAIAADPEVVEPIKNLFRQQFKWFDDEYEVTISAVTEGKLKTVTKTVRMTIFESDAADLRNYIESYNTGLGTLHFDQQRQPGVFIPIINKQ